MTTNVIVKTHTWPVEITTTDQPGDNQQPIVSTQTVPPKSERTVYLTATRTFSLKELPEPAKEAE